MLAFFLRLFTINENVRMKKIEEEKKQASGASDIDNYITFIFPIQKRI